MQSKLNSGRFLKLSLFLSLLMVVTAGLLFTTRSVHADVAPPRMPPGSNLGPGSEITQVRMMEEKVVIEIQKEIDLEQMGTARVSAVFLMQNMGPAAEKLLVRFPTSYNDGFQGYPEIKNIKVYVDNQPVPTSRITPDSEPEDWEDPMQWLEFEVNFPPGKIVEIRVEYTLNGTGEYPFVSYAYLLETGADWKGTIGSAEIIVRLPYQATDQTVFLNSSPGWGETTPGAMLNGTEVVWNFNDFDPSSENNISIALVWPSAWNKVMVEMEKVEDFPKDGEAWGRLAKIYKEIYRLRRGTRDDSGGLALYQNSKQAYQSALKYLPNDALWHAGYADLLLMNSIWFYQSSEDARTEVVEALKEMYIAYTLDPSQPFIQNYLNDWYFPREAVDLVNGKYEFYWLTQTPTLAPEWNTPEPSSPTKAVLSAATPEPTDALSSQSNSIQTEGTGVDSGAEEDRKFSLPICGSIIFFPLALGLIVILPGYRSKVQ